MRSIKRLFDRKTAVALFALSNVPLGEIEIVQNADGVRPLLEDIVVLEKMIMPKGGVGDHQRLHGRGVFLHEVGNARRAVDHDLIRQSFKALAIERFVMGKMLTE
jgi:hypothetical protein